MISKLGHLAPRIPIGLESTTLNICSHPVCMGIRIMALISAYHLGTLDGLYSTTLILPSLWRPGLSMLFIRKPWRRRRRWKLRLRSTPASPRNLPITNSDYRLTTMLTSTWNEFNIDIYTQQLVFRPGHITSIPISNQCLTWMLDAL
jgi:hypothetical protein